MLLQSLAVFHIITGMTDLGAEQRPKPAHDDPFGSTRWSMVLAAGGEGPLARSALENLCQTYWSPVHGFIARRVINREDANDLTQAFFTELLDQKTLSRKIRCVVGFGRIC